jgi:hypothetical protein
MPEYNYENKEVCEKYYLHTKASLEKAQKLTESEYSKTLYYRLSRYRRLLGDIEAAEAFAVKNLETSRRLFDKNQEEIGTSLNNLARVSEILCK